MSDIQFKEKNYQTFKEVGNMAYNEEKTQLTETEIGPGMTQMIK